MFKRALFLASFFITSSAVAGTEASYQPEQITAVDAYTVYDLEGKTGDYKFKGIKETPELPPELLLNDEGEVFYLKWGKRVYCPDNPVYTMIFVPGIHREYMGASYCDSDDETNDRLIFVDGYGYDLENYKGPDSFTLDHVYEPGEMAGFKRVVTSFKYAYGAYNKADYHAKVTAYLAELAPVQAPLAKAWEQEHAAELQEQKDLTDAYYAEMRARGEEVLRATFADDPGLTLVNDLGMDVRIDHSGTGADYVLKAGASTKVSCKKSIHKVDDADQNVHTWYTKPEHCGGEVGLSKL